MKKKAPANRKPESRKEAKAQNLTLEQCRDLLNRGLFSKAFAGLAPLAQAGDGQACYLLSLLYDRGDGTAADHEKATLWLTRAQELEYPEAEYRYAMTIAPFTTQEEFSYGACAKFLARAVAHRHPGAMLELGKMYFTGHGVENDRKKAIDLITAAAGLDSSVSSDEHIGSCYYANVELASALPYLKKAYNSGFYNVCGILSTYYMRGVAGVEQDLTTAFGILKKGAEHRNGLSEYILGCHYRDEFNFRKAQRYFQEAYNHGEMEAGYDLANILMKNRNPSRSDIRKVFSLLKNVATYPTVKHLDAIGDLGTCLHEGWGTDPDYDAAVKSFRRVLKSDSSHGVSLLGMGVCQLLGHGIRQDIASGLKMVKGAAQQGVIPACRLLYQSFRSSDEKIRYVRTMDEYLKWLTVAADSGDDEACHILGNLYLKGEEVKPDTELAEKYLGRAAALLHLEAMRQVAEITAEQEDPDPEFLGTYSLALLKIYGIRDYVRHIPKDEAELAQLNENIEEMLIERLKAKLDLPSDAAANLLNNMSLDDSLDALADIPMPQSLP
ncbi:MAG: SEL1-like repeat protein [Succinivibrionaceae bacterium]|nr:SEL1-like repeat protein [Succinivibrionaceae bacterium]